MIRIATTYADNVITISRIKIKVGKRIKVNRKRVKRRVKRVKII